MGLILRSWLDAITNAIDGTRKRLMGTLTDVEDAPLPEISQVVDKLTPEEFNRVVMNWVLPQAHENGIALIIIAATSEQCAPGAHLFDVVSNMIDPSAATAVLRAIAEFYNGGESVVVETEQAN
jgi:hypothetical protein